MSSTTLSFTKLHFPESSRYNDLEMTFLRCRKGRSYLTLVSDNTNSHVSLPPSEIASLLSPSKHMQGSRNQQVKLCFLQVTIHQVPNVLIFFKYRIIHCTVMLHWGPY